MATVEEYSIADLIKNLGGISPRRIRLNPLPGTARVSHLIRVANRENRLFELVDGTLVEKIMGTAEGFLALSICMAIGNFAIPRRLGLVAGGDTPFKLKPKLVRLPDASFISFANLPGGKLPSDTVAELVPDLAVEVLSKGNARNEMKRKLREYFRCGVKLVWFIDPRTQTAQVYTAPDQMVAIPKGGILDGGEVLPGFQLPLTDLFSILPDSPKKATRNGKKAS
jgi:Uma2 family endonuclease